MRTLITDVIVVGAGAAGLVAAATARAEGAEVVLVEATQRIGGSTVDSDGALWLPGNPLAERLGVHDSAEAGRHYLDATLPRLRPASSPGRREAFGTTAAGLVEALADLGVGLQPSQGRPDYIDDAAGFTPQGRVVESTIVAGDMLRRWQRHIQPRDHLAATSAEVARLATATRNARGMLTAAAVLAGRHLSWRLRGRRPLAGGAALVAQLLNSCLANAATVWTEVPVLGLLTEGGRVVGVQLRREGQDLDLRARSGVVLATGGFEHDADTRARLLPTPTDATWSLGASGAIGDGLRMATQLGAATDQLDQAWWQPAFVFSDGTARPCDWSRSLPHGVIVDAAGNRYLNESASPGEVGRSMYRHHRRVPSVPSHLVIDSRHRARYPLGGLAPGSTPKAVLRAGDVVRADSLVELANAVEIDAAGLVGGVARFNGFAKKGKDLDYGRGERAHDRSYADPSQRGNRSLGPIERPPFYAVRVYPGDWGTKGGVVTDADGRALREDGSVIEGLFAVGNTAASLMSDTDPAPGAGLAGAVVFAHRAGRALTR